jgi:hypothetical protein
MNEEGLCHGRILIRIVKYSYKTSPPCLDEFDGHLDTVVRGGGQQHGQQLQGEQLVHHLLVNELRQEARGRHGAGAYTRPSFRSIYFAVVLGTSNGGQHSSNGKTRVNVRSNFATQIVQHGDSAVCYSRIGDRHLRYPGKRRSKHLW